MERLKLTWKMLKVLIYSDLILWLILGLGIYSEIIGNYDKANSIYLWVIAAGVLSISSKLRKDDE